MNADEHGFFIFVIRENPCGSVSSLMPLSINLPGKEPSGQASRAWYGEPRPKYYCLEIENRIDIAFSFVVFRTFWACIGSSLNFEEPSFITKVIDYEKKPFDLHPFDQLLFFGGMSGLRILFQLSCAPPGNLDRHG